MLSLKPPTNENFSRILGGGVIMEDGLYFKKSVARCMFLKGENGLQSSPFLPWHLKVRLFALPVQPTVTMPSFVTTFYSGVIWLYATASEPVSQTNCMPFKSYMPGTISQQWKADQYDIPIWCVFKFTWVLLLYYLFYYYLSI